MLDRTIRSVVERKLRDNPVVALLGPRQCGKTTLAKEIVAKKRSAVYLDLERPSDLKKLQDPELFFDFHKDSFVCIDEVQRYPELFPVLRSVVDASVRNGQILLLGSASGALLRQSSESLAGRISYAELSPLFLGEVGDDHLRKLWLRGGFPRSYLAGNDEASLEWRKDFMLTYLERDIPALGIRIAPGNIARLWEMLAQVTGSVLNREKLSGALGLSANTVASYVDLLEHTFMVRVLRPWAVNSKKRLVKSPKVYVRDTGILHALLGMSEFDRLMGHPMFGQSWEAFAIEQLVAMLPSADVGYYRDSNGNEIDLVMRVRGRIIAVEFKAAKDPTVSKGTYAAVEDIHPDETWIVVPTGDVYPLTKQMTVMPLSAACTGMRARMKGV
jgi:predicted AAA+ superfamily ATPase